MDICSICLRTDVKLEVVDTRFSDFHDELCNYSLSDLRINGGQYCKECEYTLRKLHKFKLKCLMAIEILGKWKRVKLDKKPLNTLHTLLPQSTLGFWTPSSSTIFEYKEEPRPEANMNSSRPENLFTRSNMQNQGANKTKPGANTPRSGSVLNTNVPKSRLGQVSNENKQHLVAVTSAKGLSSKPDYAFIADKKELIENPIPIEDVVEKTYCNYAMPVIKLEGVIKTEEVTDTHKVVVLKNDYECGKSGDYDDYDDYQVEYLEDVILDSDNDNDVDDTSVNSDSMKTKMEYLEDILDGNNETENVEDDTSIKSANIKADTDQDIDESNSNIDNDNGKVKENKNSSENNKKSLAELTNISIANDDFITDDETELKYTSNKMIDSTDDVENLKSKKSVANLKNDDANSVSLNENRGELILQCDNSVEEITCTYNVHHTKCYMNKLRENNDDMNIIQENCEDTLTEYENGISSFSIDMLVNRLKVLCSELKSLEGVPIDKEHILNCVLDGKVSEYLMAHLWDAIHQKEYLSTRALHVIWCIHNDLESVFDIEYMNTNEEMKKELENRKTYECYVLAKYKCKLCNTGFKFEKHMERHMSMHHESAGNLVCQICGVRKKDRKNYLQHTQSHTIVYKCKLCPLVTYTRGSVIHHCNRHNGLKYKCEPCEKTFRSYSSYNMHRTYQHRRPHVCTSCGRTFETEEAMIKHKNSHRGKQRKVGSTSVTCDVCELLFPTQEAYESHARSSHGAKKTYTPERSDNTSEETKKGAGAINKRRPYNLHKAPKLTCPVCKAVGSYGWLILHGRLEHDQDLNCVFTERRKHLCDICGKGFVSKYTLRDHLKKHSGERQFACDLCSKRFHSAMRLQHHQQYHFPPTRACSYCDKKFYSTGNLYTHMQAHIGTRRHKCDICGKGFLLSATLKEHVNGVHLNRRRVRKRLEEGAPEPAIDRDTGTKRRKLIKIAASNDKSSDGDSNSLVEWTQCSVIIEEPESDGDRAVYLETAADL